MPEGQTFCGTTSDQLQRAGLVNAGWRKGYVVKVLIDPAQATVGGFSLADHKNMVDEAFRVWREVADVRYEIVTGTVRPNIFVTSMQGDGQGRILGQAELPSPNAGENDLVRLWMDRSEGWHRQPTTSGGKVDIQEVYIHECSHCLSVSHRDDGNGSPKNIMAPFIHPVSLRKPQGGDIQSITALYGPPIKQPVPVPTDPACPACVALLQQFFPQLQQAELQEIETQWVKARPHLASIATRLGLWNP